MRAVITGRDGVLYDPADWASSETFWQGEQANLLVADNQTEKYALGDPGSRQLLSRYAWGLEGRPVAD